MLYGTAFRGPNHYELYYADAVSLKANPGLDPEEITTYEIVAEHELRPKALQLEVGAQTMASVTLSAGVAVYPRHGGTAEAVLRAADRTLYAAKAAGRDRVCVAATG